MFHEICPEVGLRETRTVTLMPNSGGDLPPDSYAFIEMYCAEPDCDCRRVYFHVTAESNPAATLAIISWGWEPLKFYRRWGNFPKTAKDVKTMKGPALAPMCEQSELAPALLELANTVLFSSPDYVERIKRHYKAFRAKIDG
jgi:hypothetical protein